MTNIVYYCNIITLIYNICIFLKEVVILKDEIDILREQLEKLVSDNASFNQIYDISLELDSLIVVFYKKLYVEEEDIEKEAV